MLSCASHICLAFPLVSHFQFIFLRTSSPSIHVEWRCVSTLKSASALWSLERLLRLETGVGPSAQKSLPMDCSLSALCFLMPITPLHCSDPRHLHPLAIQPRCHNHSSCLVGLFSWGSSPDVRFHG